MRSLIILILFALFNFCTVFSQVEIEMMNGEKHAGLIDSSTPDKIFLRKLQDNTSIIIDKLNIKETKQLYTIIKNSRGKEFEGELMTFDDSIAVLKTEDNKEIKMLRSDIYSLEFSSYYSVEGYPFLGLSFLTPGGINLIYGNHFRKIGFRLTSGMFPKDFGIMWGLQGNFLLNVYKKRTIESNFSIAFGHMESPSYYEEIINYTYRGINWTYVAACYDLSVYGIFFEIGISTGFGNQPGPGGLFQLGYIYRFID